MQIVIEIDELSYEATLMLVKAGEGSAADIAVANGTPLPKGHGRLIDADELYEAYVKEPEEFRGGRSFIAMFREAQTIVNQMPQKSVTQEILEVLKDSHEKYDGEVEG